jgi:hypothetical protein
MGFDILSIELLSICRFFIYSEETNNYKMATKVYVTDKDSDVALEKKYT